MAATVAVGVAGLRELAGRHLGHSGWIDVTQDLVDRFADVTGDRLWIHVDVERARSGPFGGTIAHGYLVLSLVSMFMQELLEVREISMGVNYGCDRVRFPAPVRVGSRLRCGAVVDEVTDVDGGVQVLLTFTFEVEGQSKPACVATIASRMYA